MFVDEAFVQRLLHLLVICLTLQQIADRAQAEERQVRELDAPLRQQRSLERSVPLLEQLYTWLEAERGAVLPKSPMGTAIQYALNHWVALARYVNDGDLAIDNNVAERAIRPLVIGRKKLEVARFTRAWIGTAEVDERVQALTLGAGDDAVEGEFGGYSVS